jgi:cardiolipin synthase (CMP-forming)
MSSRIITLPNILTVIRMGLTPVFVSLLYYGRFKLALCVFILAGITDGLDGLLARRFNQKSQLGTILDPIADKLLLVTSFIVLSLHTFTPQPKPRHFPIPFWVTATIISRDVFIVAGSIAINLVTGFRKFRPSLLGKVSTVAQIVSIVYILVAINISFLQGYLPTVYTIIFSLAIISGIHYIFFASQLLNEDRKNNGQENETLD